MSTTSRNFKVLLILYLILLSPSLKMASSKLKHVATLSEIVYIKS